MATRDRHGSGDLDAGLLIIGAGPAGLCLAANLRRRRVPFRIVEKGRLGNSWRRMPPGLSLVSPWKTNWLSPADARFHPANAQLTRIEFAEYLENFAAAHDLHVQTGCEVRSVSRTEKGFHVDTAEERIPCRLVVSATGYFSNPVRPQIPGAEATAIPQIHYAEYRGPEQVRSLAGANAVVLIVGQRLSAGQTMLELTNAGFRVALSHRRPLQFGCSDWVWPLAYRNFAWVEAFKLKLFRNRSSRLDVRMPGGRTRNLIACGAVRTFPRIIRLNQQSILFEDGRELHPGLVLYATGFQPALKHLASLDLMCCPEIGVPLCHEMESINTPGLFFLGFEMLRNFQSRFLRGIRNDAAVLAQTIEDRLAGAPVRPTELAVA